MRKILRTLVYISLLSTSIVTASYAANPASKEWVLQQIAANQSLLTAADWSAVCTTGSPTSSTGCYGNASSAAFSKVSNSLGGFTRYANINPVNIPSSVFVKAFFAGNKHTGSAREYKYNCHRCRPMCSLHASRLWAWDLAE